MIYKNGQTCLVEPGNWKYRAIGRTESTDFRSFPAPEKIMEPTIEEREPKETGFDYYNTSAIKYPFAENSYFLFISNYYHDSDMLDVHLAFSRDGVSYTSQREPFIRLGLSNAFDSKCIYMATGMICKENDIWMYYAGYDTEHDDDNSHSVAIGRACIRRDGFVSQDTSWTGEV